MTPLAERIASLIEASGPIGVADYMMLCLFDPAYGYYTTREPFGAGGDFTTAPEISQMFGELIGVWTYQAWQSAGKPDPIVIAEIGPGGAAGRHTHPGIETGYVLEGEADLLIDGKPPLRLKAGESYSIPAGVVHDAKVHGDKSLKVLGIYVVDKTKPLASPAK